MNIKILVSVCLALVISIFINITLGFNLSNNNQKSDDYQKLNKELQKQILSLEKELSEAEGAINVQELTDDKEARKVVENFFKTQYEYTSETYKERFEKIKEFVNDDVYGQLTTAGIPDIPNIKFENKIQDMKLYLSAENNSLSGLVLLETTYTIEGLENPKTTQIFRLVVSAQNDSPKIVSLEVLGTFSSMSES